MIMGDYEIKPREEDLSAFLSEWKGKISGRDNEVSIPSSDTRNSFLAHVEAQRDKDRYVYLLLDVSGSMRGRRLEFAKSGACEFARTALGKGYKVGLISFGSRVTVQMKLTGKFEKLEEKIMRLECDGSTNMTEALKTGMSGMRFKPGMRVLWVVTDGRPDCSESALKVAAQAKKKGLDIICLGTESADMSFLQKLASRDDLVRETHTDHLALVMQNIGHALPETGDTLRLEMS